MSARPIEATFARGCAVHLIGAGGSGMAALGELLLDRGLRLSGSDVRDGTAARRLRARGAAIRTGHDAASVPVDATVVYSAAVPKTNPEREVAKARGQPSMPYSRALGLLMAGHRGIAIAGTHGKTTTSALVAWGLVVARRDPSYVIGGDVPDLREDGAAGRAGADPGDFVAEACEFAGSFLELPYAIGAILNVEADHLDHYGTFAAVRDAFRAFAARAPRHGVLVLTPQAAGALGDLPSGVRVVRAGLGDAADLRGEVEGVERGCLVLRLRGLLESGPCALERPGRAFAEDVVVAAAVLALADVPAATILPALARFRGVARRLECFHSADGVELYSDYAHHPTEVEATREALRARHPDRRLIAVFQPHQVRRLEDFGPAFARALRGFDRVVVCEPYTAREGTARGADAARALADAIGAVGGVARYAGPASSAVREAGHEVRAGDVVVLLGAGDIDDLREELQAALPASR